MNNVAVIQVVLIAVISIVGGWWLLAGMHPREDEENAARSRRAETDKPGWVYRNLGWLLVTVLVFFVLVIPLVAALWTYWYSAERKHRVVWEALIGSWPDDSFLDEPGLRTLGIGLSALAVFGIPPLVGAAVSVLLVKVDRSIEGKLDLLQETMRMELRTYLKRRDDFFRQELYGALTREFSEDISEERISEDRLDDIAQKAIDKAQRKWEQQIPPARATVERAGDEGVHVERVSRAR